MPTNYVNPNRLLQENPSAWMAQNPPPQAPRTLNSMAPQTNIQTQTTQPQQGGVQNFNTAIQGLLQNFQQLGTKPFVSQGLNAQEAQNNRVLQATSADMVGANPNLQSSVRNSYAGALSPTIQGANSAAQTFGEQLRTFGDVIQNARQFSQDYQATQDKLKDDAKNNILLAMQLGGAAGLDAIMKENPQIFKIAGLDQESIIAAAKAQEKYKQDSEKSFSSIDLGDRIAIVDQQGNVVRTIPKGATPSASAGTKDVEKEQAKIDLLDLLNQYRMAVAGSNGLTRLFDPNKNTQLNNLKGQITAVYKKQQQLGTLDAGVQKLIDSIIPGTAVGIGQLSTQGQLDAIDNFITNQGGTPAFSSVTSPVGMGTTAGTTSSGIKWTVSQ